MSSPRVIILTLALLAVVAIQTGMRSSLHSPETPVVVPPEQPAADAQGNERVLEPGLATLKPPRAPPVPVERLTAVEPGPQSPRAHMENMPTALEARDGGGYARGTYEREADRERMKRKLRRCKYLAEISRVARRDVLVEIMYERNRLGCAAFGY